MKKTLLAVLILSAGAIAFGKMRQCAHQARAMVGRDQTEAMAITSQLAELETTATELRPQAKAKRSLLQQTAASDPASADLLRWLENDLASSRRQMPAELRERLGLAWDNSPDYVLVSKASLEQIHLNGTDLQGRLTTNACAILAVTPDERVVVEAALQRAAAQHADWLGTNALLRTPPAGSVLAHYTIPANPELARRLMLEYGQAFASVLGPERSERFREYSRMWFVGRGTLGLQNITLEVQRDESHGLFYREVEERTTGAKEEVLGSTRCDVSPDYFPDLFKTFFPGGWSELAQREGFELPKESKRKETNFGH
jgi:hypothetical protein